MKREAWYWGKPVNLWEDFGKKEQKRAKNDDKNESAIFITCISGAIRG
jgi:hypothetical protein